MTAAQNNLLETIKSYKEPVSFSFLENETRYKREDIRSALYDLIKKGKIQLTGNDSYKIAPIEVLNKMAEAAE